MSDTQDSSIRTRISDALEDGIEAFNQKVPWYRLPLPLSIPNLIVVRNQLRDENLHDTEPPGALRTAPPAPDPIDARSADGSYNDVSAPAMGSTGARMGRNIPLAETWPETNTLLTPSPREISRRLLTREAFIPVAQLNLLAGAWIQFMVHDWFNHANDDDADPIEVPLEDGHPWGARMAVKRTATAPSADPQSPPTYRNQVTHWWDASQLYGSDAETVASLRAGHDGLLTIAEDGLLPLNAETNIPQSGFTENWWVGLELMHTLFAREHNAICRRLQSAYPTWSDDQLYHRARLINAALIAKIHTVEWTVAILDNPTLKVAMNANWYGLAGEWLKEEHGRISDSEVISGIPGSETDHHTAPFAMTEEFVSVYRMHPLLPDDFVFRSHDDDRIIAEHSLLDVTFSGARAVTEAVGMRDLVYSFGVAHPGALTLRNYPRHLQSITLPSGDKLDLASVDILRDRERGVPRYNRFRQHLHMPRIERFEDLTDDAELQETLREIYNNDIDSVDLMIGMFAETPPPGFGFSDTAFRIFILMASRRLKSDRFFTSHYTKEVYTPEGIEWIDDNSMITVLCRHLPGLKPTIGGMENAFQPWRTTGGG